MKAADDQDGSPQKDGAKPSVLVACACGKTFTVRLVDDPPESILCHLCGRHIKHPTVEMRERMAQETAKISSARKAKRKAERHAREVRKAEEEGYYGLQLDGEYCSVRPLDLWAGDQHQVELRLRFLPDFTISCDSLVWFEDDPEPEEELGSGRFVLAGDRTIHFRLYLDFWEFTCELQPEESLQMRYSVEAWDKFSEEGSAELQFRPLPPAEGD